MSTPGACLAPAADAVKILIDSPSQKPKLRFEATAFALAQIIRDSSPRFAVGIFGGWGSGKTTLMDAIRRRLSETAVSVVSVEFNAWRYEREPQLLIPLLDTVRGALLEWAAGKDADTRDRVRAVARRVGRIIRGLAAGLSGEVGLPGAVKVKYDVAKSIDALTMSGDTEQPQSLYVAAFVELSQAFADLCAQGVTKVVIFVDDLDRCLPENALDVLESMKLFFDLPGFVFVVGLDEDIVLRAVCTRFRENPGLLAPTAAAGVAVTPDAQLARDYLQKIFQVSYRLPPVMAEQLKDLLEAMYSEAKLPAGQLQDCQQRVETHLKHVAVRGQVNPREVKRFLNTYTLQMLVRPELERDIVLSLQTLVFRYDWRVLYDAILTDSMLFHDALSRYRDGDDRAFEDLSPVVGLVQDELAAYLRSDAVAALAACESLGPYVTSLESTGRILPWLPVAYRELGRLRREIRRIRGIESPTDADRDALGRIASDVACKLEQALSPNLPGVPAGMPALLQEIRAVMDPVPPAPQSDATPPGTRQLIVDSSARLDDVATRTYRAVREAGSALAPTTLA